MRDLNKTYKKIDRLRWHKEKAFIRMFCAFSCAILLIILLLMFPIVGDAAETKLSDLYYFNSILNSDDAMENYNGNPYDIILPDQNYRNIYYDKETAFTYEDKLKDLLDNTIDLNTSYDYITIYKMDDSYLYVKLHSTSIVYAVSNYSVLNVNINESCPTYSYRLSDGQFLHLSDGSLSFSSSSRFIVLLSTSPINYRWNPTGENGEINYMYENNQCGQGSGGLNITPPNTDIKDHMQLYEKSSMYLVPSTMNSGNFYIYPNIDDFQEQRKLDYSLILSVSCNYNVSYNNGGSYIVKYNNSSVRNYYNITASASNWGGSHDFVFPLNDSIGGTSISLNSINDALITSSGNSITALAGGLSESATNDGFIKPILQAIGGSTVNGVQVDISNILNNGWDILLNGCDYHFELYLKNNSTNVISSNPCLVYDYNFITGSGSINYDNLSDNEKVKQANDSDIVPPEYNYNNDEPNYPDTYNPNNNNEPSNNNSPNNNNNNVTNGDYSPSVVNNNNISVVPNNSSLPDKGLMNKFVRIINNDKNNTVNDLNELVGGNAYIQLVNNALYAVPQNVWNVWITALKAILGICVSAFFLKILINWST